MNHRAGSGRVCRHQHSTISRQMLVPWTLVQKAHKVNPPFDKPYSSSFSTLRASPRRETQIEGGYMRSGKNTQKIATMQMASLGRWMAADRLSCTSVRCENNDTGIMLCTTLTRSCFTSPGVPGWFEPIETDFPSDDELWSYHATAHALRGPSTLPPPSSPRLCRR